MNYLFSEDSLIEQPAIKIFKSLGYSHKESREALQEINNSSSLTTSQKVKAALKHLGK